MFSCFVRFFFAIEIIQLQMNLQFDLTKPTLCVCKVSLVKMAASHVKHFFALILKQRGKGGGVLKTVSMCVIP